MIESCYYTVCCVTDIKGSMFDECHENECPVLPYCVKFISS